MQKNYLENCRRQKVLLWPPYAPPPNAVDAKASNITDTFAESAKWDDFVEGF